MSAHGPGGSTKVVLTAILVNLFVTIAKVMGWLVSMSPSMLAEAIHSFADTANQFLVYIGIRVSKKGPTRDFPMGYGQARYLWNLISATGIFFIGFGVTTYHGVSSLFSYHDTDNSFGLALSILGFAFIAEGYALWIAYKVVNVQKGNLTLIEWIKDGDDPTSVGVLIEDAIAVLGVILASLGIASSYYFHNPVFDSIASIIIGLLLGGMAIIMGYANGRLLINRSISLSSEQEIRDYLNSMPEIERISKLTTEIISTNEIKLSLDFDIKHESILIDSLLSEKLTKLNIDKNDLKIMSHTIGKIINKIERRVQQQFPEIKYIDLEIN
jgi:zinc transporter 9